jgi:glycosyltransferase involved in cell wall biosynthesis
MRILYFSRTYTTHDRRFLAEMAAAEHETWYLRLETSKVQYESLPAPDGVRSLAPLAGNDPAPSPEQWIRLAPRLEKAIAMVAPDVIHAGPIQSCAFLTALAGFHPLLAMSWGSDILVDAARDEFWDWMTRYTLSRTDMLISDCAEVSDTARRLGGLSAGQIRQFPWGVDLERFRAGQDALGFHQSDGWGDSVVVLSTRSWEPDYGTMHLLEGFRLALEEAPALRLVLLGAGSQQAEAMEFISRHQLGQRIRIGGLVPTAQLPDFFRSADIYASCARSDGSSISLLEAMATGLPVIVTDRASNREWIADESQGLLAPFGDAAAIAACLVRLARLSPEQRRRMGERNRAVAEQRADWKQNARVLMGIYPDLLSCAK